MNDWSQGTFTALWTLLVAVQVACVPAPTARLTPSPSVEPINTRPPIKTPTLTPRPATTATPTPFVATATLFPSASPISPSPTPTPFVPVTFKSIQMMDLKTGWAVADVGSDDATHILRTEDGGDNWRDVSPMEADFVNPYFLDVQTAWTWTWDRGPTWRTRDGGQSWAAMGEFGWQPDIGFHDSEHGWKLNAEVWGLSFRQFDITSFSTTQDGGQTWQETNPPPGCGTAYMAYPSTETAWAVRAGFAKTMEGIPNLGVPFRIVTTFDGGMTWTSRQMPLPPDAYPIGRRHEGNYLSGAGNCEFISPVYNSTAIWKVALTCEYRSWMYTSANQGKTWIISSMPAGIDVDIHFVNPTTGWLFVGGWFDDYRGNLYQTTNGGQSWNLIKRTGWTGVEMTFLDAQNGWAVASSCPTEHCSWYEHITALVRTIDGGQTWQMLDPRLIP